MIAALLLTLAPFVQDGSARRAVPVPVDVAFEDPGLLQLSLHDASALTGHPDLDQHLLELRSRPSVTDPVAAQADFEKLERLQSSTRSATEGLLEAVRENMQPPLGADQRLEHVGGGSLALLGSPLQQTWLDDFLATSGSEGGIVDIATTIFLVPEQNPNAGFASRHGDVLGPQELRDVLSSLDAAGIDKITAPRVLVHPFSKASLSVVDEVAYVKDYEFKVLPDRTGEVADPIIGTVHDGIVFEVRPVPLDDGRMRVHADLTYQKLGRPIPSFETTLGKLPAPVTIQLPELTLVRAAGHFDVQPGETLLLSSERAIEGHRVVVLVQVTTIHETLSSGHGGR